MKKSKTSSLNNKKTIYFICLAIMLFASVFLPYFLKVNTSVQYKTIYSGFEVGQIAERNVYAKASIDLIDKEATQKQKESARLSVLPVFSYSPLKTAQMVHDADLVRRSYSEQDLSSLVSLLGEDLSKQLMYISSPELLNYAYDLVCEISEKGIFNSQQLSYARICVLDGSTEYYVALASSQLLSENNLGSYISNRINALGIELTSSEALLLQNIVLSLAQPNVIYDSILTDQRRSSAEEAVDTVVIPVQKGQILIEVDHVVTHDQMKLLLLLIQQSNTTSVFEMLGHIIFDAIVLSIGLYVFSAFLGKDNLHYLEYHVLLLLAYLISLTAAYFLTLVASKLNLEFSDSFLPVFFLSLFMTEVSGYKRLGFVASFMLSCIMATLPTATTMTFFYCLISSFACVVFIRFFNRRVDMIYQWFFSCVTCTGISILFVLINEASFNAIFTIILGTLMNVSIAYILLAFLLPLVEKVFNLPTIFRLYELAYGQSPLLSRLSQAAPGTYSHCLVVADLAEAGARAIGANPLLARVGGLYHDIGKVEHPEYFIENQSGINKHDDISPSLSVAVIKSHVKVGADKGREAGLPIEIVKIISSHHGNDVIHYFYHEALKTQAASADNKGETVKASDYSYNAEIPDFRECAIVMLADSIEAASRTVTPNATKYSKLLESIFMGKIERGQLDNCNLTMNEVKALSDAFVKTLVARNHSRIEYPDDED